MVASTESSSIELEMLGSTNQRMVEVADQSLSVEVYIYLSSDCTNFLVYRPIRLVLKLPYLGR